ncbi:MAG: YraN family protein [Candidatus Desulfofervidaceae bacterium]|nr:YraN family protein [Candidatus Desulfofervidaceae bacterium]MDL1970405.1 YraN family protein [Candidatus Desulfofervidaceae bacterium]
MKLNWPWSKKDIGKEGERLAKEFLKTQGYKIVTTNYQNKLGEIDIIAWEKDTLVFVEVKTRRSGYFGLAKEAVDKHKQHQMIKVAMCYLKKLNKEELKARFDVVAIDLEKNQIELIRNAFCL